MLGFILYYSMNDIKNIHVKCILGRSVMGDDTLENKEEKPQARLEDSLLMLKSSAFVVLLGPCESRLSLLPTATDQWIKATAVL